MQTPLSGIDLLVPFIVALAKQAGFSKTANTAITIAVYVLWTLFTLVTGLRTMPHDGWAEIAASFPVAFSAAIATGYVAYTTVYKNLFNEEQLSLSTSIVKGPTEDPVVEEPDPVDAIDAGTPAPDATPAEDAAPDETTDPIDDGTPQG